MKTKIVIVCGVILILCLLLFKFQASKQGNVFIPQNAVISSNQIQQSPSIRTAPNLTDPTTIVAKSTPQILSSNEAQLTTYQQKLLSGWQAPISFYGKVLDESNNPVADANIQFSWSETPFEDGEKTTTTQSDSEGLFSLNGQRGHSLQISVGKMGYYTPKPGFKVFTYSLGDTYLPDLLNPAVFHIQKKGIGENLISTKQNYRIARDGTPLKIKLATGKVVTEENADFIIQCWTDDQGKQPGQKYDWHCVISIPGGGIVTTKEEFAFQAPENGYGPSQEIVMLANRPNWRDDVDLKFFYRLADGNYGRMTFSMIAGGQHFCMIDSVLNPSGSRNLEPK